MFNDNQIIEEEGKIVLRSVYKLPKLNIEPAPDPKTGRYADHVKISVDEQFNLTEKERDSGKVYIGTHEKITLRDGISFDLDDPHDKAWWDAIKHSKFIARTRYMRNAEGQYVIDGGKKRYGVAEFYVEIPGKDAEIKVNKRRLVNQAESFILDASNDDLYSKVRLLGSKMDNFRLSEVQEYMLKIAQKNPDKIIDLFTGKDIALRLLILDAVESRIIQYSGSKFYQYGNTVLGVSQEAVLNFLKDPVNVKILGLLRKDVYPNLYQNDLATTLSKTTSRKTTSEKSDSEDTFELPALEDPESVMGAALATATATKPATTSRAKK